MCLFLFLYFHFYRCFLFSSDTCFHLIALITSFLFNFLTISVCVPLPPLLLLCYLLLLFVLCSVSPFLCFFTSFLPLFYFLIISLLCLLFLLYWFSFLLILHCAPTFFLRFFALPASLLSH